MLPVAVPQDALQVDAFAWVEIFPLLDFLFQRAIPIVRLKLPPDLPPHEMQELFSEWQAGRS